MKILQLTKKYPLPTKDGESLAIKSIVDGLNSNGCEVDILAMSTLKHKANKVEKNDIYGITQFVKVDTNVDPIKALLNLLTNQSYNIARFKSKDYEKKLIQRLNDKKYDIVLLETSYLLPYVSIIKQHSSAKVVLRSHNLEFEIWNRLAANSHNVLKKIYFNILSKQLREFEHKYFSIVDAVLPITERDMVYMQEHSTQKNYHVVPIGVNLINYELNMESYKKELSVSFIGSLDWMPNLEGLLWFIHDIFPAIRKKLPHLKLHIAGRNTPEEIFDLESDAIIVHGEVDSAIDFIQAHSVMVVPLLSGGGMRAKIVEAMSLGRTLISTSVGAEGINYTDNKDIFIANTVKEFVNKVEFCSKSNIEQIGFKAKDLAYDYFDNKEIGKNLVDYFRVL